MKNVYTIVLFLTEMVNLMKCWIMFHNVKENLKNTRKIVEYNLFLKAHNGSGFDSYVASNNLPQGRSVVSLIKNGAGIVSLSIFKGYVDQKKFLNM